MGTKTNPERRLTRNLGILGLAVAMSTIAFGPASAGTLGAVDPLATLPPQVADYLRATDRRADFSQPLPEDPTTALTSVVAEFLADLGFPTDQAGSIAAAGLSDGLAGRIALLLEALLVCERATTGVVDHLGLETLQAIWADPASAHLDPADFEAVQACVTPALTALGDLELEVALNPPADPGTNSADNLINIWPVLVVDLGGNDDYHNDYMVVVELGGNDVYDNNAGSNMIDLRFAPASSPVPGINPSPFGDGRDGFGESEGCMVALGSLIQGNCTPLVSAFLDTGGNDQYGVFEAGFPGIDTRCTTDLVVQRMVSIGVGFTGLGVLVDSSGNDRFNGKTSATGAGHIFGAGVLVDREGNDRYLNVRNSQGFALIGGVGIHREQAGNDRYDFYLPSALVPGTPNEQDGAGGVIDDTDVCDTRLRFLQGGANLNIAGGALLLDERGDDTYIGGFSDDFDAPFAATGRGGSQGFGNLGSFAALVDLDGDDSYTIVDQVGSQGSPARGDGVVIGPNQESTGQFGAFADLD